MFEEYEILTEKLNEILPFKASPARELVVQLRSNVHHAKLKIACQQCL